MLIRQAGEESLDLILDLAGEVPWLREECGLILCDSVRTITSVSTEQRPLDDLVEKLRATNLIRTPEGVAIWLTIRSLASEFRLPKGIWRDQDPLCVPELPSLAKVMKMGLLRAT